MMTMFDDRLAKRMHSQCHFITYLVIMKHLGLKKVWVCMNRLHSSVAEHSLRTQEVPGSIPGRSLKIFFKLETKISLSVGSMQWLSLKASP